MKTCKRCSEPVYISGTGKAYSLCIVHQRERWAKKKRETKGCKPREGKNLCPRCQKRERHPKQGYCLECHRAVARDWAAQKRGRLNVRWIVYDGNERITELRERDADKRRAAIALLRCAGFNVLGEWE